MTEIFSHPTYNLLFFEVDHRLRISEQSDDACTLPSVSDLELNLHLEGYYPNKKFRAR